MIYPGAKVRERRTHIYTHSAMLILTEILNPEEESASATAATLFKHRVCSFPLSLVGRRTATTSATALYINNGQRRVASAGT